MRSSRRRLVGLAAVALSALSLVAGCGDGGEPCELRRAIVTDIDETLTTGDGEWVLQMFNPAYDAAMRPDADTLMNAYADLGYAVFYVTARTEGLELADGGLARPATEGWLEAHGFPLEEGRLFLAEGDGLVQGEEAVTYKRGVLEALEAEGWVFDWAYGNAETDVEAFLQAGIASDRVFLVGRLAGTMEVRALPDDEAYTAHLEDQLPLVGPVGCD